MKQADLFAPTAPVHYGPTPTPGLNRNSRIAVCGVIYTLAGGSPEYRAETGLPEAFGSSNLAHVTCSNCLDVVEARKCIMEAGE